MKINMPRQNIYILFLSIFLLIFVFTFSFSFLIPEGKEYRNRKSKLKQDNMQLRRYQNFRDDILDKLTNLQSDNKHIITAFDSDFDPLRFQKQNKGYFESLTISPRKFLGSEDEFSVYEVNTTSHIDSPTSFYEFLDAVNKSDWIISVNLPIHFKRDGNLIRSSFTMKVYEVAKDSNSTK